MNKLALLIGMFWASAAPAQQVCARWTMPEINACSDQTRLSLAIVGDVLLHRPLQWRGYARGFETIWGAAIPYLSAADIAIANLEGPTAAGYLPGGRQMADPGPVLDDAVYSGYPSFNYHPVVVEALREAGVDIVTTANNHALDRGSAGLDATLAALGASDMQSVGAVRSGQTRFAPLRVRSHIGALSFISCTFGTNGIVDRSQQVPLCYEDRAQILQLVEDEVQRGAGVLVLPHWGREYELQPDAQQRRFARDLVEAGALAIVGTHPHVPQPWDIMQGPSGEVPIIFSTGNFVAAQPPIERATSILAWLELCSNANGPRVTGAGYVPLQMEFDGNDPSLTVPRPGMGARAEAGLALLARLIPGRDLTALTECRQSRRSTVPVNAYER